MATLVDANVLLDILTDDEAWGAWSAAALATAAEAGPLVNNPIVYAEGSVERGRRTRAPTTSAATGGPAPRPAVHHHGTERGGALHDRRADLLDRQPSHTNAQPVHASTAPP
ncbi:MAG: hypothetical protein H0V33_09305 [Acidimicrobiia bacterium]|nr:hypothetical protein [Acidimicrobiia bacterium]